MFFSYLYLQYFCLISLSLFFWVAISRNSGKLTSDHMVPLVFVLFCAFVIDFIKRRTFIRYFSNWQVAFKFLFAMLQQLWLYRFIQAALPHWQASFSLLRHSRCFSLQRAVFYHWAQRCDCRTSGSRRPGLSGSRAAAGHHQVAEERSAFGRERTHTVPTQWLLVHTKDKAYEGGIRRRVLPVPLPEQIRSYPKPKISTDYRKWVCQGEGFIPAGTTWTTSLVFAHDTDVVCKLVMRAHTLCVSTSIASSWLINLEMGSRCIPSRPSFGFTGGKATKAWFSSLLEVVHMWPRLTLELFALLWDHFKRQ